jgi:hypothetical protein
MGLFGNRDLKIIDRELTTLKVALALIGHAEAADKFQAGVASARTDALAAAGRLRASGKQDRARAKLASLRPNSLSGETRVLYEGIVDEVVAALG